MQWCFVGTAAQKYRDTRNIEPESLFITRRLTDIVMMQDVPLQYSNAATNSLSVNGHSYILPSKPSSMLP